MFKLQVRENQRNSGDFLYACISSSYVAIAIACLILFSEIIEYSIGSYNFSMSASVIAYVFLFPIAFVVVGTYGYNAASRMVVAMLIGQLIFILFGLLVTSFHIPNMDTAQSGLNIVLHHILKWYLCSLVAMPAGVYTGFVVLNYMIKIFKGINIVSIFVATIIGEFVNTLVIFPTAGWGEMSWTLLYKLMTNAFIFKVFAAFVLGFFAVIFIKIINGKTKHI